MSSPKKSDHPLREAATALLFTVGLYVIFIGAPAVIATVAVVSVLMMMGVI